MQDPNETFILKVDSLRRLQALLDTEAWHEEIEPELQAVKNKAFDRMTDPQTRGTDLEIARAEFLLANRLVNYPHEKILILQKQIKQAQEGMAKDANLNIAGEEKNIAQRH